MNAAEAMVGMPVMSASRSKNIVPSEIGWIVAGPLMRSTSKGTKLGRAEAVAGIDMAPAHRRESKSFFIVTSNQVRCRRRSCLAAGHCPEARPASPSRGPRSGPTRHGARVIYAIGVAPQALLQRSPNLAYGRARLAPPLPRHDISLREWLS